MTGRRSRTGDLILILEKVMRLDMMRSSNKTAWRSLLISCVVRETGKQVCGAQVYNGFAALKRVKEPL